MGTLVASLTSHTFLQERDAHTHTHTVSLSLSLSSCWFILFFHSLDNTMFHTKNTYKWWILSRHGHGCWFAQKRVFFFSVSFFNLAVIGQSRDAAAFALHRKHHCPKGFADDCHPLAQTPQHWLTIFPTGPPSRLLLSFVSGVLAESTPRMAWSFGRE